MISVMLVDIDDLGTMCDDLRRPKGDNQAIARLATVLLTLSSVFKYRSHIMYFLLYMDTVGEWPLTLYAANHEKMANGGGGYKNKSDCQHGIELVKSSASAEVRED